jgi:hypothetical protein
MRCPGFSAVVGLGLLGCSGPGPAHQRSEEPGAVSGITDLRLGDYRTYQQSVGDTWDPAWADDDNLYSASNDTSGWDEACASNIAFNKIAGSDFLTLKGQTINGMSDSGGWGAPEGPDGRTWKSSGCLCLDGTLYLVVGRHMYGDKSKDPFRRQTAINSSIIKSPDHGVTWTRSFQECYEHPMFKGNRFATPYFIYYGKDGSAPVVDNAGQYVYAVSNNGFWNNGDKYFLGRAKRSAIRKLDATDWQFYLGGDGMKDENWSSDADNAMALIDNPTRCGMTGATYLPAIQRYILIGWYYPRDMNTDSDETRFIYYQSPHPWGPWTVMREEINRPAGWYSPRVLAKWQVAKPDGLEAVIAAGGDFWEIPWFYKFAVIPLRLKTSGKFPPLPSAPRILVVKSTATGAGEDQFNYQGDWKYLERNHDLGLGEYYSTHAGDSFTVSFHGSRIRWYSCKGNKVGIAAVSLDGKPETSLDLWTRWATETLYNRLAYDSGSLPSGRHTLTVKVIGQKNSQSTGNEIFNERVEIEP